MTITAAKPAARMKMNQSSLDIMSNLTVAEAGEFNEHSGISIEDTATLMFLDMTGSSHTPSEALAELDLKAQSDDPDVTLTLSKPRFAASFDELHASIIAMISDIEHAQSSSIDVFEENKIFPNFNEFRPPATMQFIRWSARHRVTIALLPRGRGYEPDFLGSLYSDITDPEKSHLGAAALDTAHFEHRLADGYTLGDIAAQLEVAMVRMKVLIMTAIDNQ